MLTWLIPVARTARVSRVCAHRSSGAFVHSHPIGSAYEFSPARVLRRRRRRGLLHASCAAGRHRAAVALPAHPGARGRARTGAVLDRLPRGVSLTPAGRTLLPEARSARARASNAAGRAHARRSRSRLGELEIATVLSMAVGVLPAHIGVWHERYPDVAIRLHEFRHRTLLEDAVEQGVADFAIGPLPLRAWDGPLEMVSWEEFVIVVATVTTRSPSGSRSARGARAIANGCSTTRITGSPESSTRSAAAPASARAGRCAPSQAEGAVRLAAAGLGLALVPDNIVLPGDRRCRAPLRAAADPRRRRLRADRLVADRGGVRRRAALEAAAASDARCRSSSDVVLQCTPCGTSLSSRSLPRARRLRWVIPRDGHRDASAADDNGRHGPLRPELRDGPGADNDRRHRSTSRSRSRRTSAVGRSRPRRHGVAAFVGRRAHFYKRSLVGGSRGARLRRAAHVHERNVRRRSHDPTVKPWTKLDTRRLTAKSAAGTARRARACPALRPTWPTASPSRSPTAERRTARRASAACRSGAPRRRVPAAVRPAILRPSATTTRRNPFPATSGSTTRAVSAGPRRLPDPARDADHGRHRVLPTSARRSMSPCPQRATSRTSARKRRAPRRAPAARTTSSRRCDELQVADRERRPAEDVERPQEGGQPESARRARRSPPAAARRRARARRRDRRRAGTSRQRATDSRGARRPRPGRPPARARASRGRCRRTRRRATGKVARCDSAASWKKSGHVSPGGSGIAVSTTRAPSASSRST